MRTIAAEIGTFTAFSSSAVGPYRPKRLGEHAFLLAPPEGAGLAPTGGKKIGLTLMGITHGSEWAGIAVLNGILQHIAAGNLRLEIPVAFVLGNVDAARENKRFLDCDLNRSFARSGSPTRREEKRARELEAVLRDSSWFLDYHQVSQPSDRPFFIFPHSGPGFEFAMDIDPYKTVVTHWGDAFSSEGMCSDEYVNSQGGTGITLELGQNGFDTYQIAAGVDAGLWAIHAATARCRGVPPGPGERRRGIEPEIFTWGMVMDWPSAGLVNLIPGLTNFCEVQAGQVLGHVDGRPITAGASGRILFPKYLTHDQQKALATRPTELCRIMKPITGADLPRD